MDQGLQQVQNNQLIPVYSPEKRRVGEANPNGDPQAWEQRYVNCWPEIAQNPANPNAPADIYLVKRPGLQPGATLTNTIGSYGTIGTMSVMANICMTQLTDVYVGAWFDSTASKIYIIQYRPVAGTTTKIGELTTTAATDYVFLSEITQCVGGTYPAGTLTPALAVTWMNNGRTSAAGYYATTSGGVFTGASLTQIASNYPTTAGGGSKITTGPIVQMNGTNYVMTTEGTICASGTVSTAPALFDITTWDTNGIVVASMYPDLGVGLARYKNLIVAFGQSSIEFFQDASQPPPNSPLERVEQAFIKIGCLGPKCYTNIDDTIYWIAYSVDATNGVWRLDGFTPKKISTPYIDYGIASRNAAGVTSQSTGLEFLLLNYTKHLVVNGCTSSVIGGISSTDTTLNLNTNSGNTEDFSIGLLSTSVVCFSIENAVWWSLNCDSNSNFSYIKPATAQSFTSNKPWQQYCFVGLGNSTKGTLVFQFGLLNIGGLVGNGDYVDFTTSTPSGYTDPVTAYFQLNTLWFGTERKKRINKVKLICDMIGRGSTDSTHIYALYMGYAKDQYDFTSSSPNASRGLRQLILTASGTEERIGRYYFSNIGQCRSLSLFFALKHPGNLRVHGVEIEADQGTR